MSFSIGGVLKRGLRLTASRAGVLLMVLYAAYGVIYQLGINGVMAYGMRSFGLPPDAAPPAVLDVPVAVSAALTLVGLVLGLYVTLVSIRTLVAEERHTIPSWTYTRRPIWGIANLLAAGILFSIVLAIGFALLIIPGFIAYVAFIFVVLFIADEDVDFITAFRRSWQLSRGNWLRIAIVLLILFAIATIVAMAISMGLAFGFGAVGLGRDTIGLGTMVLFSPIYIYLIAVLAEMYNGLRAAESERADDMERL